MFNPKVIGAFAGVGFALSLITGLISGNSFGHCLTMAFIFALVFAVVGVAVLFIYQSFLSTGQSDSSASAETSSEPVKGSRVDITLDDENLPDDDGPKFFVNNSTAPVTSKENSATESAENNVEDSPDQPAIQARVSEMRDENVKQDAVLDELPSDQSVKEENNNSGFVPVNLGTSAEHITEEKNSSKGDSIENLDELPDVSTLAPDEDKSEADNDNVISDSDFASAGSPPPSGPSFPNGQPAGEQNTAVMAEAIRTILARQDN